MEDLRYNIEPITCSTEKGSGESNDSIDWVEQAIQRDPNLNLKMQKRNEVNDLLNQ